MSAPGKLLRDPLVHFLAAGALLFAVYAALHRGEVSGAQDSRRIVIDRPALVTFMQYRSAAFQPQLFDSQFAAMSAADKKGLIDQYVQEEALVREARTMGLDQGDYVIRRRLMQKMLYLLDDTATQTFRPTQAELSAYFERRKDAYQTPSSITFTHVFIDNEVSHPEGGQAAAQQLKARLEARHAGFDDASGYGDRVPYLQNYVDRAPDFVQGEFGQGFTAALMRLQPSAHWQGPIRSDYGWHLVLVTGRKAASAPKLAEVQGQVKDDLLRETIDAYRAKAVTDLTRRFSVQWKGPAADLQTASSRAARQPARTLEIPEE